MSEGAGMWSVFWLFALPLVAAMALVIPAGVISASGRHGWNHQEPIPAHVLQLSAHDYVLLPHSPGVVDVCRGGADSIKQLQGPSIGTGLYASCHRPQTWSDHREHSPSFGTGIMRTLRSRAYPLGVGGLTLLVVLPGLFSATLGEGRDNRRRRRADRRADEAKAEAKLRVEREAKEAKQAALAAAWTRGEITDAEFEGGLDKSLGIKRKPS